MSKNPFNFLKLHVHHVTVVIASYVIFVILCVLSPYLCRAIADDNRGKQMLMKFGWQDGQGLGRDNTGRQEPVSV